MNESRVLTMKQVTGVPSKHWQAELATSSDDSSTSAHFHIVMDKQREK